MTRAKKKLGPLTYTVFYFPQDNFDPVCHFPFVPAFVFDGGNLRLIVRTLACISVPLVPLVSCLPSARGADNTESTTFV